jgi:hypothetical protein
MALRRCGGGASAVPGGTGARRAGSGTSFVASVTAADRNREEPDAPCEGACTLLGRGACFRKPAQVGQARSKPRIPGGISMKVRRRVPAVAAGAAVLVALGAAAGGGAVAAGLIPAADGTIHAC